MQMPANRLSFLSAPLRGSREGDQLGLSFRFHVGHTRKKNRSKKVSQELSHTEGVSAR